jgi:hypothetical protein
MRVASIITMSALLGLALASTSSPGNVPPTTPPPLVATGASLAVVDRTPLTVAGRGFAKRERVTVRVTLSQRTVSRTTRAGTLGAFRVSFDGLVIPRCEALVLRAVGARTSLARTKLPPLPACQTG